MGLTGFFTKRKEDEKQCVELIISDSTVQAVLWEITDQGVKTISTGETLPYQDSKDLIFKTDQTLQTLGKEAQKVSQVVFALELSWIDQNGILAEHKQLLKKLTQELSLKAVGFIVVSEALAQYLIEEHPQISTLIIQVETHKISLSLIQEGDLQKTESLPRSENTLSDILEGLARLQGAQSEDSLPANINLVSFSLANLDLYGVNQALTSHDWQNGSIFYSPPVIKTIDKETGITALINQSGKALAQSRNLQLSTAPTPEQPAQTQTQPEKETNTAKSFGVPISTQVPAENPEIEKEQTDKTEPSDSKLKQWISKHRLVIILGFIGGLLALMIMAFVYLTSTSQAMVKITPQKTNLNQDVSIVLDSEIAQSNFEELILKAQPTSVEITVSQTTDTTGVTLVGEKASGQVQIINKTENVKTFEAGTTLYKDDFRYTLNDDVTVASASVEEKTGEEVKTYGTASVTITSVEIGAERNLDEGTDLKVADFADNTYKAVVEENGVSGGSSRELRVVSQEDQTSLLTSVKKEILKEAEEKFQEQSDGDEQVIPTQSLEIITEKYDAEIGDEAKTLSLSLTAEVEGISYQKEDLKPLAKEVLSDLVPEGYQLAEKDPQILSDLDQTASGSAITIEANINSEAWAELNLDQVKQEIMGKNITQTQDQLQNNDKVKSVSIELKPAWLKSIWPRIPGNPNRVKLELK